MTGKIGIYFAQNYGYRLQDIREYDTVQDGLFCVETVVRQKKINCEADCKYSPDDNRFLHKRIIK
ncbi:hypothetical protein DW953_14575 [Ruminococcus sp. AM45-2]|nr:hypothetical protein DW953_14575 [Ruminococcus sp. AM45-2]